MKKVLLPLLLTVAGFAWWTGAFDRSSWQSLQSTVSSALPGGEPVSSEAGAAPHPTVYEWTDAQGRRHFSDVPPPGVKARPAPLGPMTVVTMPKPKAETEMPALPAALALPAKKEE